ncbi:hypothetical protein [Polaromonas sp. CG9_12]|nr:hypothetical protein [Polaromonas sp. CG9_12]
MRGRGCNAGGGGCGRGRLAGHKGRCSGKKRRLEKCWRGLGQAQAHRQLTQSAALFHPEGWDTSAEPLILVF